MVTNTLSVRFSIIRKNTIIYFKIYFYEDKEDV